MRRLPGSHPPNIRNRSSKHLSWLCGPGTKPVYRSMNNTELKLAAKPAGEKKPDWKAQAELTRREKKRAKREAKA